MVLHSILASPRHRRLVPADGGALAFDMDAGLPATVDGVPVGEGTLVAQGESVAVCGSLLTLVGDPIVDELA